MRPEIEPLPQQISFKPRHCFDFQDLLRMVDCTDHNARIKKVVDTDIYRQQFKKDSGKIFPMEFE